jgi:hypothetical protein
MLVIADIVLSLPILATLMMEVIRSPETPVLTGVTRRNIPEDGIPYPLTFYLKARRFRDWIVCSSSSGSQSDEHKTLCF